MGGFEFGLIIPCYNYAPLLPATLQRVAQWRQQSGHRFQLCLVDDGSTDATPLLLEEFRAKNPDWCVTALAERNGGKGAAIRRGAALCDGNTPYLLFTDCDLHYGLSIIQERILPALGEGAEVVILDRSWNRQFHANSPLRKMLSYGFNHLKTILTGVPFEDSQAGMKGFSAPFLRTAAACSQIKGFAFDVELLSIAIQYRFRVDRIPILLANQANDPGTSVTAAKALRMFWDLLRIAGARMAGTYAHPAFLSRIKAQVYEIKQ